MIRITGPKTVQTPNQRPDISRHACLTSFSDKAVSLEEGVRPASSQKFKVLPLAKEVLPLPLNPKPETLKP